MVASDNEQDRILRSQNGDHEAFESLVRDQQRMIHGLCYRMTGSMTDAEDLAQESFIQAFENLGSFRAEARFSSWLYRIAVNRCLNWKKAEVRRVRLHDQCGEQVGMSEAAEHDQNNVVQEALMKLDPKQRAAIILTVYDGLNHAEAARILRCSETTVSWRVFAARRKLKSLLKDVRPRV
jgi:RNA polymerase sigma-70 factor (ECF subfamily)